MCGGGLIKVLSPVVGMADAVSSMLKKPEQPAGEAVPVASDKPVIGTPETAKTTIGDSGAAVASKQKPRSLLSAAGGAGDTGAANTGTAYAKPTLGA